MHTISSTEWHLPSQISVPRAKTESHTHPPGTLNHRDLNPHISCTLPITPPSDLNTLSPHIQSKILLKTHTTHILVGVDSIPRRLRRQAPRDLCVYEETESRNPPFPFATVAPLPLGRDCVNGVLVAMMWRWGLCSDHGIRCPRWCYLWLAGRQEHLKSSREPAHHWWERERERGSERVGKLEGRKPVWCGVMWTLWSARNRKALMWQHSKA